MDRVSLDAADADAAGLLAFRRRRPGAEYGDGDLLATLLSLRDPPIPLDARTGAGLGAGLLHRARGAGHPDALRSCARTVPAIPARLPRSVRVERDGTLPLRKAGRPGC